MSVRQRSRGIGSARRDPIDAVLAAHVPPSRVAEIRTELPQDRDQLMDACTLLKRMHGATNESLLVALTEDAGVSVRRSAEVLGMDGTWAHAQLDAEAALDPEPDPLTLPRHFEVPRRLVWVVWAALAGVGLLGLVQEQGGAVPCLEDICLDEVDLLLDPDEISDASLPTVRDPDDVVGLRYEYRAPTAFRGTLEWTIDGLPFQVQTVVWIGNGEGTVLWQEGEMPAGVHRVTVIDEGAPVRTERSAITFVVRRLPAT